MNARLTEAVLRAAHRLKSPVWLVGGPVRDEILNRSCEDWDLVCRKSKAAAKQVAQRLRAPCVTLDDKRQIYRVVLPENYRPLKTLDFAELKGRTIEEDLGRRDFTLNAMARAFPEGPVIDPHHGRRDLRRGVLRAISEKAFAEDPLRLLRAFRFAAQFGFTLEPRTLKAIHKYRQSLAKTTSERIREELLRLWKQPHSAAAMRQMDRVRLLTVIFPEIEACRRTATRYYGSGGVLKHSLETVENLEWIFAKSTDHPIQNYLNTLVGGYPRSAWLKFGAFLHDVGKPATAKMLKGRLRFFEHEHVGAGLAMRIGERLRCSRQEVQLLGGWVRNHMRTGSLAAAPRVTDKALSRYFRDLGENGVGMILISLADHYTYLSRRLWRKKKDPVERLSDKLIGLYFHERTKVLPERLVNGHDLMRRLKLKPGPVIGQLLEEIQDAQAGGTVRTREEALALAKRLL